jgi:CRP/FNR family transcriptional regulator, anaerobic regulatory protein
MHQYLIENISKKVAFTKEDIQLCEQYFIPSTHLRNSIIDEQDKIPQYLYFVNAGYMRLFFYDDNGDEATSYITGPQNFIASFLSLVHQQKTIENVECITDCELLSIKREDVLTLIEQSENFKQFSLVIFENAMASSQLRANDLATLSAEQRYKKLIETQPQILQNVPIQYIASYLGIKPQSLSRIRKQFIK